MIRTSAMGFSLCFLVSCNFGDLLGRTVVQAYQQSAQQSAEEAKALQAERNAAVQQKLDRRKREAVAHQAFVDRERTHFQEWLDHWQRAWVPVAVVSEVALRWPKVARANQITVTQQEVSIQATNSTGAQAIKGALENAQWVEGVTVSENVVTGQVAAVKRALAPDNESDLLAERKRLAAGYQYGSHRPITDFNEPRMVEGETDAFNCWRRVMKMSEGYTTMDGDWVEPGMRPVPPEKHAIQLGAWVELPEKEEGKHWGRDRAYREVRGPFSKLVQGLDCVRQSRLMHGIRKIDLKRDPSSRGNAVLVYEVDLIRAVSGDSNLETPWAKPDSWGEAERPERVRVLKDKTLANPFAK